jgi:RNA polymerase sigma-70 factor (ECF subfamily)
MTVTHPAKAVGNVRPLFESPAQVPDGALVRAAREGQAWAQEALFKRYARVALGQAWRLIPSDDPEDLAQDALVHALTHLDRLSDPQAFAAWLTTIVVRLATTRLRKRRMLERLGLRRGETAQDVEAFVAAPSSMEERVQVREVYRVLETLPAEERVALVLRRVEGLELSEIAAQMGLSLATVKRRLVAAEARLSGATEAV